MHYSRSFGILRNADGLVLPDISIMLHLQGSRSQGECLDSNYEDKNKEKGQQGPPNRREAPNQRHSITFHKLVSCLAHIVVLWYSGKIAALNDLRGRQQFNRWHTPSSVVMDKRVYSQNVFCNIAVLTNMLDFEGLCHILVTAETLLYCFVNKCAQTNLWNRNATGNKCISNLISFDISLQNVILSDKKW